MAEPEEASGVTDMSLVTGGMRYLGVRDDLVETGDTQLATQNLTLANYPSAGKV